MKDRIRQVMESKHMTQQQFAQAIDMAPATLSSIFNGRTKPTLNIVEAIKKKFSDISTDWLMFGSGTMTPSPAAPSSPTDEAPGEAPSAPQMPLEPTLDFGDYPPLTPPSPQKTAEADGAKTGVRNTHPNIVRQEVKYFDKPQRQITEIRVYFDDLTFETFVPAKK